MFNPVDSKTNFPQLEEKILSLWKSRNVFPRSVEARRGRPLFILYDGPPTLNGSPALHHVFMSVFKDALPRYKAMKGYYAPRIGGWDTHGLPVELEVEKKLGISSKPQIEAYGVGRFNALCRQSVNQYLHEFETLLERVGYWVDLENAYITMSNDYIESCWWAIKQMWDKGLIYQGYRVTPHCPRCGTSLSSHEVAQGYQEDTEDPSVYIKFKVVKGLPGKLAKEKPVFLLAWTTTPWTLPGNTALAVVAKAKYAVVEVENEYIVLADALREPAGLGEYKVVVRVKGSELVGVHYEPLYNALIGYGKGDKKAYRVIEGDFVSMDEGTGIVHVAPAYGEIDFEVGEKEGLPLVHAVDLDGSVKTILPIALTPKVRRIVRPGVATSAFPTGVTPEIEQKVLEGEISIIRPNGERPPLPGHGKFVKDADKDILDDLKSRGLLLRSETIKHTYPFCWRCESPLLYYAKETWYIKTTAVKDRLISGNEEINWYPEHIKYGRFGDWLQNNVDWALSRERYWGTPLPVWRCQSCGAFECIGGMDDLKKKSGFSGFKEPLDLHRPYVDELTFKCEKCGGMMQRVPEVIDCWFDSGAMPFAQGHYPFENETLLKDGRFPADYICEAVDQTRGWFYSLHAISTLLFDRPCYKNVICLGLILDAKGEKMSKRKGNVVWPWDVINKYGADALRWYLYTASAPGNPRQFDAKQVQEVSRRFLSTLWNVYSFFITYANIDRFTPEKRAKLKPSELDRWIISELNQLIADVDGGLDGYNPTEAGRNIEAFVDDLSNWYVRRSRRRFWKSESDADKLAAYTTLYECLVTLAKLLAPFTPFLAEELYQNLVVSAFPDAPDSVHLADFPASDKSKIDKKLSADTRLAMKVCSLGRAARSQAGIKVRQPLAHLVVGVASSGEKKVLERLKPQILEELNVKELKLVDSEAELAKPGYEVVSEGGHSVAIPKEIPPELEMEGVAREIVRRLQTMRRSAGFDIADHIVSYYQGDDYIKRVMAEFAEYIKQETLSRELVEGAPEKGAFSESHKLSGHEITLGVRRLA
jgi:isoleucyl-tRNA synthetase